MEDLSRKLRTSRNARSASLFRAEATFSSAAIANGRMWNYVGTMYDTWQDTYIGFPWKPCNWKEFTLEERDVKDARYMARFMYLYHLNHLEAEGSGPTSNMYEQCMIHGKIHVLATIFKITFLF